MKKSIFLLAMLVINEGKIFSVAVDDPEVIIYNDSKPGAIAGMALAGIGVTLNIFKVDEKVPTQYSSVIRWGRLAFPPFGSLVAIVCFLESRNPTPYLIINDKGFRYEQIFYPWRDIKKMTKVIHSPDHFLFGYLKLEYLKIVLNKGKEIEIRLDHKSKLADEIIGIMTVFYEAFKEDRQ